jgi:2-dehydropantoate 2-reductase
MRIAILGAGALGSVRHMEVGSALLVQNGIKKNAQLAEAFGADAVLGAISVIAAAIEANAAANYVMENHTLIGEPSGGTSARAEDIVGRLVNAKLVASVPENILCEEWTKYVLWLGVATMALMLHQATWKFLADPDMARVAREAALLTAHLGISLRPEGPLNLRELVALNEDDAAAMIQQAGKMIGENSPSYRPSILQDVHRGKSIEVEETFGHAVSLAREYGLAVPTLETCYHMLAAVNRLPHLVD